MNDDFSFSDYLDLSFIEFELSRGEEDIDFCKNAINSGLTPTQYRRVLELQKEDLLKRQRFYEKDRKKYRYSIALLSLLCILIACFSFANWNFRFEAGYNASSHKMQSELRRVEQDAYEVGYNEGLHAPTGGTLIDIETGKVVAGAELTPYEKAQFQLVYITDNGEKYHRYGCHYLTSSAIPVSQKFAIDEGYTACSKCLP